VLVLLTGMALAAVAVGLAESQIFHLHPEGLPHIALALAALGNQEVRLAERLAGAAGIHFSITRLTPRQLLERQAALAVQERIMRFPQTAELEELEKGIAVRVGGTAEI
jgi:hypothetical protein